MKEFTRSSIARLLATENITVVQDNVRTASFDVKNRVLRLPSWSDVESYTEDHFIGHECGHALFTPEDGWHEAVCDEGPAYKSYLNVVEDARIEKLIQRKYPGLRAPFIKSYRKLLKDGFFGGQLDDINKMSLIDRINVYFKCGQSIGVKFNDEETQWLPRIESAETWEDVIVIVDELFDQELEKKQQRDEEQEQEMMLDEDDDDPEASDWDLGDEESDGEDGEGEDTSVGEDDDEYSDEYEEETPMSPEGGMEGSQTDKILRDNIANEIMDKEYGEVFNLLVDVPKNYSDYIVPLKDIIDHLKYEKNISNDGYRIHDRTDGGPNLIEKIGTLAYNDWLSVNKKAVNHMVKEFEMRKSAAEYARASVSKTGVIDTVKMNHYKLTDDIFKKVTILPEGKNHGFIMYLDMSGSMQDYMYETVEQTLLLAHFAKQINVPFRVYGFTSTLSRYRHWDPDNQPKVADAGGHTGVVNPIGVSLLELFSDKMSRAQLTFMSKALLSNYIRNRSKKEKWNFVTKHNIRYSDVNWVYTDPILNLGGTPLNHALTVGTPLARDFRASNRIDILNTILLTDGMSHDLESFGVDSYNSRFVSDKKLITYTCPLNKKTYKLRIYPSRLGLQTDALMQMYKDVTGSSIIGYRIESNKTRDLVHCYSQLKGTRLGSDAEDELAKQYRSDGWVKVDNAIGYDECFILNSKSMAIEDNKMDDLASDASKAKIRGAFKKAQGNTKKSRRMLTDLMERVS
jgi:hypothetical protein